MYDKCDKWFIAAFDIFFWTCYNTIFIDFTRYAPLLGVFNNKRTIWENTECSHDAEIFKQKYQSCNEYIYVTAAESGGVQGALES